jgi:3-oxoacyl-[acyl-carrier protein] reductase
METGLKGKAALVCAASRGLGKAAAMGLAREGARLAICARSDDSLERAAEDIRTKTGAEVVGIPADLMRADDVARFVAEGAQALGGVDVLVTNAGGPKAGLFDSLSEEDWMAAVQLTLMSVIRLCRATIPHMRARSGGRIINITSMSVKQPIGGLILSNALRPAVIGFSKTLSTELAAEKILVNCVAPGYTRTERVLELNEARAKREGVDPEALMRSTVSSVPMGRLGEPSELADLIVFLASDRASYITGTTIQVDGGFIKSLM